MPPLMMRHNLNIIKRQLNYIKFKKINIKIKYAKYLNRARLIRDMAALKSINRTCLTVQNWKVIFHAGKTWKVLSWLKIFVLKKVRLRSCCRVPFPIIFSLGFLQHDKPEAKRGTYYSLLLPYPLIFLGVWLIMRVTWYLVGLPTGPGIYPGLH